jgi:hypothetical protein
MVTKSTNGDAVNLSAMQKLVIGIIMGLMSWTLLTVLDTRTELKVFGERLRSMDAQQQARDDEIVKLREETQALKGCFDRHVISDGHVITIRRIERIEKDVKDLQDEGKKDLKK